MAAKSKQQTGLGKGFGALLPKDLDKTLMFQTDERVLNIEVERLEPNRQQPRRNFSDDTLKELASSIKEHGVLQPIIATSLNNGRYEITAGERRWRASKLVGLKMVPVVVRGSRELQQLEVALVENIQRDDLLLMDQARSIERLHHQFSMTFDEIAQRLGKGASTITNIVRLLQLPEEAQAAIQEQKIVEGHARQILSLRDYPEKQKELLDLIIKRGWSVRQAERFVTAFKKSSPDIDAKEVAVKIKAETPQTKRLSKRLGRPVSVRHMAHGGKLEIGFGSDGELDELIQRLMKS